jgi:hypothetical protein
MKSFMDGIMSPLVSCWQPPINSCVPGCMPQHHRYPPSSSGGGGADDSSIVAPMPRDRERERQGHRQPYPPHDYHHLHHPQQYLISPRSSTYRHGGGYDRSGSGRDHIPSTVPSTPPPSLPGSSTTLHRSSISNSNANAAPATNIEHPHSNDVLCGRGGSSNRHLGNMHFRELVAANKKTYVGLTKKQKMLVARKIVEMVHQAEPPGRFLSKDLDTGSWYDIGLPRSLEKTSQALREKNSNDVPDSIMDGIAASSEVLSQDGTDEQSATNVSTTPTTIITNKKKRDEDEPSSDDVDEVEVVENAEEDEAADATISASSSSATPPAKSTSNKSSKNVEAPPITVPSHLRDIYGPRVRQPEHLHGCGSWLPDYPPSYSSSRHHDPPYMSSSYPITPSSPAGSSIGDRDPYLPPPIDPYHHSVSTPSPYSSSPSYHRYGEVTPPSSSSSSYHHGPPDHRDHYGETYHPPSDRRDYYLTPPRPEDQGRSSWSSRLPLRPPGHLAVPPLPPSGSRHRPAPPPPPKGQYHPHQGPPPLQPSHLRPPVRPPTASHSYRGHAASPVPHQQNHPSPASAASSVASPRSMQSSAPTSPVSNASTGSYEYDYDYYLSSRHHHQHQQQQHRHNPPPYPHYPSSRSYHHSSGGTPPPLVLNPPSSNVPPPHHPHYYDHPPPHFAPPSLLDRNTPGVRSKAEMSPERRQEWKRQRDAQGTVRRLSETSLSRAMEDRLSLGEYAAMPGTAAAAASRDEQEQVYGTSPTSSRLLHPSDPQDPTRTASERVVMGHRQLLQHHRATHAATATSTTTATSTMSKELVGESRKTNDRDILSPSGVLQSRVRRSAPIGDESDRASAASTSSTTSSSSGFERLAGLAALSTAAFLKLDETD